MRHLIAFLIFLILVALLISGCGGVTDPAARVVEDYYQALVNKDAGSLSSLSCADWEANALLELDSIQAVEARLDKLTCNSSVTEGSTIEVNCQGRILTTYNNEDQELDLSIRTYLVIQQAGEYLYCGYK